MNYFELKGLARQFRRPTLYNIGLDRAYFLVHCVLPLFVYWCIKLWVKGCVNTTATMERRLWQPFTHISPNFCRTLQTFQTLRGGKKLSRSPFVPTSDIQTDSHLSESFWGSIKNEGDLSEVNSGSIGACRGRKREKSAMDKRKEIQGESSGWFLAFVYIKWESVFLSNKSILIWQSFCFDVIISK